MEFYALREEEEPEASLERKFQQRFSLGSDVALASARERDMSISLVDSQSEEGWPSAQRVWLLL